MQSRQELLDQRARGPRDAIGAFRMSSNAVRSLLERVSQRAIGFCALRASTQCARLRSVDRLPAKTNGYHRGGIEFAIVIGPSPPRQLCACTASHLLGGITPVGILFIGPGVRVTSDCGDYAAM